jgi:hypothetical protein
MGSETSVDGATDRGQRAAALSRAESRAIVARLRSSGTWRQVRDVLRPRGISGLWRSRAPLWLQLMIADRDGRLLRDGDAVAVREPPLESARLLRPTWLHWVDQLWDVLCFLVPPLVLLVVAAALALVELPGSAATAGLLIGLLALLWVAVGLTAFVLRGALLLFRRRSGDLVLGQLRTLNPTVTLLHAPSARAATALLDRAAGQRGPLLVLSDGITMARPAPTGPGGLRLEPLSDRHAVLVARRRDDRAPRAPTAPGRFRAGDAVVILGGSAAALAIAAWLVADAERAACGTRCDNVAASYGTPCTGWPAACLAAIRRVSGSRPSSAAWSGCLRRSTACTCLCT